MPIIPGAVVVPANIDDLSVTLEGARTIAQLYGYESVGGVWDRVHVDASGYLQVSIASAVVDTELPAAAALTDAFANPTVPGVGSFLMGFDGPAGTWERVHVTPGTGHLDVAIQSSVGLTVDSELPAAAALTDAFANPTAPAVGAFLMGFDAVAGDWERAQVQPGTGDLQVVVTTLPAVDTELPAAAALTDAFANPTVPGVGSFLMGWDSANSSWERVHVNPDTGHLDVAVQSIVAITGAVTADTELAAAVTPADALANQTTAPVVGLNMVWNNAEWDFLREGGVAGSALVDVADRAGRLAGVVVTEMSAAAALSDTFANPTPGGVGAFSMGFDGTDWERLRVLQAPNAVTGRAVGNLAVGKTEGKATYRVAFKGLVAAGAGVAVKIIGSASTIVRITKVMIAKPSVAQAPLRMVKTSTAAAVAASTTPAGIPLDSADAAATAVVTLYTAVPVGGTEIGTGSVFEADVGIGDVVYEAFGDDQNTQALILRGVAETLEVDLSAGATIDGYIEWTEE